MAGLARARSLPPRSPGRSRTYVACPDSKSGGPCRQTNRGSATGSGAYAMGHREDPAEGQHGAVRGGGVRRAEPPPELGLELLAEPLGKGLQGGPGAGAADPGEDRVLALEHVEVGGLPRVDLAAERYQPFEVHLRAGGLGDRDVPDPRRDRKSTRLNSSHANISYAVFCLT